MPKYVFLLLSLYFLVACSGTTISPTNEIVASPTVTYTPFLTPTATYLPITPAVAETLLPETNGIITSDNAKRLTHLATWGDGNTNDAEFTPDGKYLIVASSIGIHFYDTPDYSFARYIEIEEVVRHIAVSADGQLLATVTPYRVLLYELQNFTRVYEIEIEAVTSLAFSPDAELLVTSSRIDENSKGQIQLWEVETGALMRAFGEDSTRYFSISFSPDGDFIVTGSFLTEVWQLDGTRLDRKGSGHDFRHSISPLSNLIAVGSRGTGIDMYTLASLGELTEVAEFSDDYGEVLDVAISPDEQFVASTGRIRVDVVEVSSNKIVWENEFAYIDDAFRDIVWSPDGNHIITSSQAMGIEVWDAKSGELIKTIRDMTGKVFDLAWTPQGESLFVGTGHLPPYRGNVFELDASIGVILHHTAEIGRVRGVDFSTDGENLAISIQRSQVQVRNVEGSEPAVFFGNGWGNAFGQFSWNDEYLIMVLAEPWPNVIQVWQSMDWNRAAIWDLGDEIEMSGLTLMPNLPVLAYTDRRSSSIAVFNYLSGEMVQSLDTSPGAFYQAISFSPGGDMLGVLLRKDDKHEVLWVWNTQNWGQKYEVDTFRVNEVRSLTPHRDNRINGIAWSPDGKLIAYGVADGGIVVIDAVDGDIVQELSGHNLPVTTVAFSPDGKLLASGSLDGTVRLWGLK